MPDQKDYPASLRESHDSNRAKLLEQLSIISVAGLGYNLVWAVPKDDFVPDLRLLAWLVSTIFFLAIIIAVMALFYLIGRRAEIHASLSSTVIDEKSELQLLRKSLKITKWITWLGFVVICTFTTAIISVIYVVVDDVFF